MRWLRGLRKRLAIRKTLPGTDRATAQPNDPASATFAGFSPRFWVIVVLTGVLTGLAAGLLMLILRAVQHLCYGYSFGTFLDAVKKASFGRRMLVLLGAGLLTSGGLWALRKAPGGRAGRLEESIWFHSGRLSVFKTLAQGVLSITIVGMGASLGRENAPKQAGSAFASWLARHGGLSLAETRLLVACGTGAGMAAVYNVPLGGALFALEVLLGTLSLPLIPPALATSFIATAVSWLLLPAEPTYGIATYPVTAPLMAWALWFGPVAGLASVAWVRLIIFAARHRPRNGRLELLGPFVVFAALGLVALQFPQVLGNGKDIAALAFIGALGLPLMLALTFLKPLATAACLGCGAPGGLFTPSISFGAMLGGVLGGAWAWAWPGAQPGSYAMIGATAVLAGSMQAPIAAIVLMIELTRRINTIMVPILVAVAGAALVARAIDRRSAYSGRIDAARPPTPDAVPPATLAHFGPILRTARTISVAASYAEVLARFVGESDGASPRFLYVLDETDRLVGRIAAADAACPAPLIPVLNVASAADLARPVTALSAALSGAEVLMRLDVEPTGELPVVAADTGRLLGIAALPRHLEASAA
jgi:H+/Cl- antiporter ClcA